jgi:hypothetical protein
MAFRERVPFKKLEPGDDVALYVTRGAFNNPTRDQSQVVAIGRVASEVKVERVQVAGARYHAWCELELTEILPLREGVPFRPLVEKLDFIVKKPAWSRYLQRTLVEVSDRDFALVRSEVRKRATAGARLDSS